MAKSASTKKRVEFILTAPEAQQVALAADFNGWDANLTNLKKVKDGKWKVSIPLEPGTYQYRFLVDGQWIDDPQCNSRVPNAFGTENCVRVVG